jgi:hypothetical protein
MRKMFNTKETSNTIVSAQVSFLLERLFGNEINLRVVYSIPERTADNKTVVYKYYTV